MNGRKIKQSSTITSAARKKHKCVIGTKALVVSSFFLILGIVKLTHLALSPSTVTRTSALVPSSVTKNSETDIGQTHYDSDLPIPVHSSKDLPEWIQNYLKWHTSVRSQYPGSKLFTDPNAPKILIRTCLGLCGGLNDRLGQLPWDLYLANQTKRVLLLHWHRPVAIEHFLIPNELDWRVPINMPGFFPKKNDRVVSRDGMRIVRAYRDLFEGFESTRPEPIFWQQHLDTALQRAVSGKFRNEKILRHRILGHLNEDVLEERLRALGETDMLHWTPSFGNIFWMFFRPVNDIKNQLATIFQELNISPFHYSAVHCRVRHPKANPKNTGNAKSQNEDYPADRSGLAWEGQSRAFAIETATHALQCTTKLLSHDRLQPHEPVYFFSDSIDLVQYISHNLTNSSYVRDNKDKIATNLVDYNALQVVQQLNVIARETTEENAHIDRQKGRAPHEYYSTFIDFFLAIYSRCLTYGIGYYAIFATKVSGTTCKLLYQEEFWGGSDNKRANTRVCKLDDTM